MDALKTKGRQFWEEEIHKWELSGRTRRAWCRENDLSYYTFTYWYKKLANTNHGEPGSGDPDGDPFVELDFIPKGAKTLLEKEDTGYTDHSSIHMDSGHVSIRYRDYTVEVRTGASKETLAMILEVLGNA